MHVVKVSSVIGPALVERYPVIKMWRASDRFIAPPAYQPPLLIRLRLTDCFEIGGRKCASSIYLTNTTLVVSNSLSCAFLIGVGFTPLPYALNSLGGVFSGIPSGACSVNLWVSRALLPLALIQLVAMFGPITPRPFFVFLAMIAPVQEITFKTLLAVLDVVLAVARKMRFSVVCAILALASLTPLLKTVWLGSLHVKISAWLFVAALDATL